MQSLWVLVLGLKLPVHMFDGIYIKANPFSVNFEISSGRLKGPFTR